MKNKYIPLTQEEINEMMNTPSSILDYFSWQNLKFRFRQFKNLFRHKANATIGSCYYPRHDKSLSVEVLEVTDYSVTYKKNGSVGTRSRQGFEKSYLKVRA